MALLVGETSDSHLQMFANEVYSTLSNINLIRGLSPPLIVNCPSEKKGLILVFQGPKPERRRALYRAQNKI